jgi:hypothetical protein
VVVPFKRLPHLRTADEDLEKVGFALGIGRPGVLELAIHAKEDDGERNVTQQSRRRACQHFFDFEKKKKKKRKKKKV